MKLQRYYQNFKKKNKFFNDPSKIFKGFLMLKQGTLEHITALRKRGTKNTKR